MAIENQNDKVNEEEEGEVDLEAEIVSGLTEHRKVRRECKHFKEEIKNLENEIQKSNKLIESTETMITNLKLKTKEARVTKEALNNLLVEKEKENDV
jgi:peptidoglycan hydrolase CwlO-like protein